MDITAVVLAGGESRRFGADKASALLAGRPLLDWVVSAVHEVCSSVLVVRARGQRLPPLPAHLPVAVIEDRWDARGPLAGLASAFPHVKAELCFAVSCDAPLLRPAVIGILATRADGGADAVVPRVGGFFQPLVACYRPSACLAPFEQALASGEGRLQSALDRVSLVEVGEDDLRRVDPELDSFRNANTREALAEIEVLFARRGFNRLD